VISQAESCFLWCRFDVWCHSVKWRWSGTSPAPGHIHRRGGNNTLMDFPGPGNPGEPEGAQELDSAMPRQHPGTTTRQPTEIAPQASSGSRRRGVGGRLMFSRYCWSYRATWESMCEGREGSSAILATDRTQKPPKRGEIGSLSAGKTDKNSPYFIRYCVPALRARLNPAPLRPTPALQKMVLENQNLVCQPGCHGGNRSPIIVAA